MMNQIWCAFVGPVAEAAVVVVVVFDDVFASGSVAFACGSDLSFKYSMAILPSWTRS